MPHSFIYRNHKGETEARRIAQPASLEYLHNPGFGYQPGWFLTAFDLDKDAMRSFRLSHFVLEGGGDLRITVATEGK